MHIPSRCFVCYSASARGSSSRADADHGHKLNCFRVAPRPVYNRWKNLLRRFANFHRSRDSETRRENFREVSRRDTLFFFAFVYF